MKGVLTALLVIAIGMTGYIGYRKITAQNGQAPDTDTINEQRSGLPLLQEGLRRVGPAEGEEDSEEPEDVSTEAGAEEVVVDQPAENTDTQRAAPRAEDLRKAMALKEEGGADNLYQARKILTELLMASPEGSGREEIRETLDEINSTLFFSRAPSPDSERYVVKQGDSLWVIQNRVNRSLELIKLVNRMTNDNLRVNESLKIPKGDFSALVQKRRFRIIIFLNDHYIKEYPIAIGEDGLTPTGIFTIKNKHRNPSWTSPEGKFLEFGHPENPLGTRWLGFDDTDDRTGLGIHGTNDDSIIGTKGTNGCIRLYNKDVEEVFGMLRTGDRVRVVE